MFFDHGKRASTTRVTGSLCDCLGQLRYFQACKWRYRPPDARNIPDVTGIRPVIRISFFGAERGEDKAMANGNG